MKSAGKKQVKPNNLSKFSYLFVVSVLCLLPYEATSFGSNYVSDSNVLARHRRSILIRWPPRLRKTPEDNYGPTYPQTAWGKFSSPVVPSTPGLGSGWKNLFSIKPPVQNVRNLYNGFSPSGYTYNIAASQPVPTIQPYPVASNIHPQYLMNHKSNQQTAYQPNIYPAASYQKPIAYKPPPYRPVGFQQSHSVNYPLKTQSSNYEPDYTRPSGYRSHNHDHYGENSEADRYSHSSSHSEPPRKKPKATISLGGGPGGSSYIQLGKMRVSFKKNRRRGSAKTNYGRQDNYGRNRKPPAPQHYESEPQQNDETYNEAASQGKGIALNLGGGKGKGMSISFGGGKGIQIGSNGQESGGGVGIKLPTISFGGGKGGRGGPILKFPGFSIGGGGDDHDEEAKESNQYGHHGHQGHNDHHSHGRPRPVINFKLPHIPLSVIEKNIKLPPLKLKINASPKVKVSTNTRDPLENVEPDEEDFEDIFGPPLPFNRPNQTTTTDSTEETTTPGKEDGNNNDKERKKGFSQPYNPHEDGPYHERGHNYQHEHNYESNYGHHSGHNNDNHWNEKRGGYYENHYGDKKKYSKAHSNYDSAASNIESYHQRPGPPYRSRESRTARRDSSPEVYKSSHQSSNYNTHYSNPSNQNNNSYTRGHSYNEPKYYQPKTYNYSEGFGFHGLHFHNLNSTLHPKYGVKTQVFDRNTDDKTQLILNVKPRILINNYNNSFPEPPVDRRKKKPFVKINIDPVFIEQPTEIDEHVAGYGRYGKNKKDKTKEKDGTTRTQRSTSTTETSVDDDYDYGDDKKKDDDKAKDDDKEKEDDDKEEEDDDKDKEEDDKEDDKVEDDKEKDDVKEKEASSSEDNKEAEKEKIIAKEPENGKNKDNEKKDEDEDNDYGDDEKDAANVRNVRKVGGEGGNNSSDSSSASISESDMSKESMADLFSSIMNRLKAINEQVDSHSSSSTSSATESPQPVFLPEVSTTMSPSPTSIDVKSSVDYADEDKDEKSAEEVTTPIDQETLMKLFRMMQESLDDIKKAQTATPTPCPTPKEFSFPTPRPRPTPKGTSFEDDEEDESNKKMKFNYDEEDEDKEEQRTTSTTKKVMMNMNNKATKTRMATTKLMDQRMSTTKPLLISSTIKAGRKGPSSSSATSISPMKPKMKMSTTTTTVASTTTTTTEAPSTIPENNNQASDLDAMIDAIMKNDKAVTTIINSMSLNNEKMSAEEKRRMVMTIFETINSNKNSENKNNDEEDSKDDSDYESVDTTEIGHDSKFQSGEVNHEHASQENIDDEVFIEEMPLKRGTTSTGDNEIRDKNTRRMDIPMIRTVEPSSMKENAELMAKIKEGTRPGEQSPIIVVLLPPQEE